VSWVIWGGAGGQDELGPVEGGGFAWVEAGGVELGPTKGGGFGNPCCTGKSG
jgi:hypothetical protein